MADSGGSFSTQTLRARSERRAISAVWDHSLGQSGCCRDTSLNREFPLLRSGIDVPSLSLIPSFPSTYICIAFWGWSLFTGTLLCCVQIIYAWPKMWDKESSGSRVYSSNSLLVSSPPTLGPIYSLSVLCGTSSMCLWPLAWKSEKLKQASSCNEAHPHQSRQNL